MSRPALRLIQFPIQLAQGFFPRLKRMGREVYCYRRGWERMALYFHNPYATPWRYFTLLFFDYLMAILQCYNKPSALLAP
jgi:hypothetical protein